MSMTEKFVLHSRCQEHAEVVELESNRAKKSPESRRRRGSSSIMS